MGLKKFFKKAGGWIKDKFHKVKNVVAKFAKPVVKVVKNVTDWVDKTPLKPILDKVTGGIYSTVKGAIDLIPDGDVKNNATKFADNAKRKADEVSGKIGDYHEKAKGLIDKGRDYIDRGQKAYGIIKNGAQMLGNVIPNRRISTIP